jgi:hypothetical protein
MHLPHPAHGGESGGQASAQTEVTPEMADAAAWRLWQLIGDEEQKISVDECRHLIAEVLSAAGLRMVAAECAGETFPESSPSSQGPLSSDDALRRMLNTPPKPRTPRKDKPHPREAGYPAGKRTRARPS